MNAAKIYYGPVRNGTIVLDEGVHIPEGTRVQVTIAEKCHAEPTEEDCLSLRASLLELAGTVEGLPPDFADEHDHCIHGTPKRKGRVK
jgi:hypothetical protein